MISAVVAEFQFVGFATDGDARQLMSETDSKNWLASHQAADVVHRVGAGLGIAGAVGEEHSIGLEREHIFRGSLRRNNRDLAALAAQLAQDVVLDPEVVR